MKRTIAEYEVSLSLGGTKELRLPRGSDILGVHYKPREGCLAMTVLETPGAHSETRLFAVRSAGQGFEDGQAHTFVGQAAYMREDSVSVLSLFEVKDHLF